MSKEEIMNRLEEIRNEYQNKIENINDVFDNLDDDVKVGIIIDYCNDNSYEHPEYMSSFDELMEGLSPTEIVDRIGNDFRTGDEYFWFDGYGNAHSGCAWDVINQFGDDIDNDYLMENRENYSSFDDFNDELNELSSEYDDLIDELYEMGEDTSEIPDIDD